MADPLPIPESPVPSNQFPWVSCPEIFGFVTTEINVQKVRDILGKLPIEPIEIDVKSWSRFASMVAMETRPDVSVDLRVPVLLIELPGEDGPLMVDGYHRLEKAEREGISSLRAYMLPKEHFFAVALSHSKFYNKFKPRKARKPRAAKV